MLEADGIVVQSGGSFEYDNPFILEHQDAKTSTDLDVSGTMGLVSSTPAQFTMNSGATIVFESGSIVTNFGLTSGDHFTGPGYGSPGSYVPGAITFKSGSTYVQTTSPSDPKGFIPFATWQPGSTCMIAPGNSTGIVFQGMPGQTFANFVWYWPLETVNHKFGGTAEAGSFTVNGNFSMTAGSITTTNSDFPNNNASLTVGGNISLTNVTWAPIGAAGVFTLNVGGNFWINSDAGIKVNNGTAVGDVNFTGTSPQTLTINGVNGSAGGRNRTVNSGATVNLNSPLVINYGVGYSATMPGTTAGALTVNGAFNLTSSGALSGTSNTITVAHNATMNVSQGTFSLAAEDTLQGAGTITGPVTAGTTSVIYPGTGAPLTFVGGLSYGGATSTNIFNLTSSTSGANDQIVVNGGTLNPNGAQIVINPLTTLATASYVLFNVTGGGAISSSFNPTPGLGPSNPWKCQPIQHRDFREPGSPPIRHIRAATGHHQFQRVRHDQLDGHRLQRRFWTVYRPNDDELIVRDLDAGGDQYGLWKRQFFLYRDQRGESERSPAVFPTASTLTDLVIAAMPRSRAIGCGVWRFF